ncbi:MAG: aconitate hydratase AcnA [Candidatus Paracaedibacteraceae bacterium]|nr:aconitate hydratase AcnA [Candidatus Paracaedibacteraceae bacterium]
MKCNLKTLVINEKKYSFAALSDLAHLGNWHTLPYSIKVLLENVWRHCDGITTTEATIKKQFFDTPIAGERDISFFPARVLMQDFTGVPAVVDLAAMRDAIVAKGGDPSKINPQIPVDLVIDHSVMIDEAGSKDAFRKNVDLEYKRNLERYTFLKWGQQAFENFRVVPPGTGICHQVNLEYLASVVFKHELQTDECLLYPDTLVGTDSHTTMVNALGVLGWGVGGIEAESAMLGQPLSMLIPEVVGVDLKGNLPTGCTATDLVLTITEILRKKGVVGKFVEFYGNGLDSLTLADRATIANMAPEYGATCGFFPVDNETLAYLRLTGRSEEQIAIVEAYTKEQGLWRNSNQIIHYNTVVEIDLNAVVPSLAGPKRPQDKINLTTIKKTAAELIPVGDGIDVPNADYKLFNHNVVIAAITSCTNTSNPSALIGAGLLAQKANALGLTSKPWVKTSLAPGSQVAQDYLSTSGLLSELEKLGFYIVGFGCTTCIGNSGPLAEPIAKAIEAGDLTVSGVLSGNRNFEGRIHAQVKANYLASPALVVAFALTGTTHIDLTAEPIGIAANGTPIYLKDIWPSKEEIDAVIKNVMKPEMFKKRYSTVFNGDEYWKKIDAKPTQTYSWDNNSTYVKNPPYFNNDMKAIEHGNIKGARILALLGDSITTDHISPAGNIKPKGPAGSYLMEHSVDILDFNSYGARRGNHEIMMRGTFANIRIQNELTPEQTGGVTRFLGEKDTNANIMSIFDAAMRYQKKNTPLIIIAGKEYGTGSSRDWAAKGTRLLGIRAVIAESFERIHRSNLVGMGVIPLVFKDGITRKSLNLTGHETLDITGLEDGISPGMNVLLHIHRVDGKTETVELFCRIDTREEVCYMQSGGILPYVLSELG